MQRESGPHRGAPGTIHLICNAHLDPIWQWDWEEGLTEALATFEIAADLLEEHPDFVFNHNESLLYAWTLTYCPKLFQRIRKLVRAGRWHIAGGWYLQPDCNLPLGEACVPQSLLGRRFFRRHFGVTPRLAFNFDAFGHHGNLPQLLRRSGYEAYLHFRPDPKELSLPAVFYRWRGIDGSEVLGYRPDFAWYGSNDARELEERLSRARDVVRQTGLPVALCWGMGDHGGGATRADLALLRRHQKTMPELRHSTTDDLLADLQKHRHRAPLYDGDLQRTMPGCYTSAMRIKQQNRRAEGLALAAERWAALAWWRLAKPYPAAKLAAVWRDVLLDQFHDVLPGSSVRSALACAQEIHGRAMTQAREIMLQAQLDLMKSRRKRPPLTLLVFNPHARRCRVPVVFDYVVAYRPIMDRPTVTLIQTRSGRRVPAQHETAASVATIGDWRKRLVLTADLPALGMAEYRLQVVDRPRTPPRDGVRSRATATHLALTNAHVRVAINRRTGWLDSLVDRQLGQELLARPGARLLVCEDPGGSWGENMQAWRKVVGVFRAAAANRVPELTAHRQARALPAVRIVEHGPVRTVVETVQVYGPSQAILRYVLYADLPQLDIDLWLLWNASRRMLKLSFPTIFRGDRYRVEIPYGSIERRQNSGEQTPQRWLLLDGPVGRRRGAFGVVSQGPAGHDVHGGEIRLSVVRSPIHTHAARIPLQAAHAYDIMDLGEHQFQFRVRTGPVVAVRRAVRDLAEESTLPVSTHVHIPLKESAQFGLPADQAAVDVRGRGVALGALKVSEDSRHLVVRLAEQDGRRSAGALHIAGLPPYPVQLGPFELRTLKISRSGRVRVCDLMEEAGQYPRRVGVVKRPTVKKGRQ